MPIGVFLKTLTSNYKLWFSTDESRSVFGDGKYRLLQAIKSEGSLRLAAQKLHISYRKAWGDLRKAENGLNMKLIEKIRGGKGGGQTLLTEDGEKILKAYSVFRKKVSSEIEISFKRFLDEIE